MKLIKFEDGHYVIVSDEEIKIDDIVLETYVDGSKGLEHIQTLNDIHPLLHKKVTHASIPIEGISLIDKYEIKELIGEVDVEKKARECVGWYDKHDNRDVEMFTRGYNQALEDNKDRKYTEQDVRFAYMQGYNRGKDGNPNHMESYIKHLQPKTSWEVEFVDGKLKLK